MKLVVVSEECQGECLVQETPKHCLHDIRNECVCLWEDLEPDAPPADESAGESAGS
ncbi:MULTISPECIES: hypothetical protein [Dechloromonas]|uniref:hypothetical protein n=1 Tax=Dechloromonas TaxID=73029 RepID=UPI001CF92473|nr:MULTISPECIES: hypothetical protein [Dechloromonas]